MTIAFTKSNTLIFLSPFYLILDFFTACQEGRLFNTTFIIIINVSSIKEKGIIRCHPERMCLSRSRKLSGRGGIYSIHLSNPACGYEKARQHEMGQLARFANDYFFPFEGD